MKTKNTTIIVVISLFVAVLLLHGFYEALLMYVIPILIMVLVGVTLLLLRRFGQWKISDGNFYAICGIVLTVLFFLIQNLQTISDVGEAVHGINNYNCSVADDILKDYESAFNSKNTAILNSDKYLTDVYKLNMPYLLGLYGGNGTSTESLYNVIKSLDQSNSWMDYTRVLTHDTLNIGIKTGDMDTIKAYWIFVKQYNYQIAISASSTLVNLNKLDPKHCSLDVLNSIPASLLDRFVVE